MQSRSEKREASVAPPSWRLPGPAGSRRYPAAFILASIFYLLTSVSQAQKPTTWTIYDNDSAPGGGDILGSWSALSQIINCGDYKVCGWVDTASNGFTTIYGSGLVQWDVRTGKATVLGENTNETNPDCAVPQAGWPGDRHVYGLFAWDNNRKRIYMGYGACISLVPLDFGYFDLTNPTPGNVTWTPITTVDTIHSLMGGVNHFFSSKAVFNNDDNILTVYGPSDGGLKFTFRYCPNDLNPTTALTVNQVSAGCVLSGTAPNFSLITTTLKPTSHSQTSAVDIGGGRSIWFGGYDAGAADDPDPFGGHNETWLHNSTVTSGAWLEINDGTLCSPPENDTSNFDTSPLAYAHGLVYHASVIDNHWHILHPLKYLDGTASSNCWTDLGLDTNIPDVVNGVNFGETMVFDPASNKFFFYYRHATEGLKWATVDLPQMSKESAINGLGASTTTCMDKDGDGYGTGTGTGCTNGADADDNDAAVNTTATVLSTYGSLLGYFQIKYSELGLTGASRLWHVSSTGNNGTCAVGSFTTPPTVACATMSHFFSNYLAGDTILIRSGGEIVDNWDPQVDGTAAQPVLVAGYPGEKFVYKGNNGGSTFNIVDRSNLIIDCLGGDLDGNGLSQEVIGQGHVNGGNSTNIAVRNCFLHGAFKWQLVGGNGLRNYAFEDNVAHGANNSGEEHVSYLSTRTDPVSRVVVRRNIIYNSGVNGNGFQFNGRFTDLHVDQNMFHSNRLSGISLLQSVFAAKITNNISFNNGRTGLILFNYDGDCLDVPTPGPICPYDQIGNLIEGNTFWTGVDPFDGSSENQGCFQVANNSTGKVGDIGHQIFRNNICVGTGLESHYPPIIYNDDDKNYFATSTFQNNTHWSLDGATSGSTAFGFGPDPSFGFAAKTCAAAAVITTVKNCNVADPLFTAASTTFWNSPASFNFAVTAGSPALSAGSSLGALAVDIDGTARSQTTPTIGALEAEGGGAPAPTHLPMLKP